MALICGWWQIIGTALTYFRRFYIEHTIFEHNPHGIRLGCIYLACKVEEYFYPAEKLSKDVEVLTKAKDGSPNAIQKAESILLDGLKFDLVVFSPYRPLDGSTLKLQEGDVISALGLSVEQLDADVRKKAREVVDALLLTDLQLCYPPGRIAFAALAFAISTVCMTHVCLSSSAAAARVAILSPFLCVCLIQIKGGDLLKTVDILSESMELPKELSGQDLKQSVSKIAETIQKIGCEVSQYTLSNEELKPLEQRRKAWRHPESNPDSSFYKHAKGRDSKKESKKAAASSKIQNTSGMRGKVGVPSSEGNPLFCVCRVGG